SCSSGSLFPWWASAELPREIGAVELAAEAGGDAGIARQEAGTAQPVEATGVRRNLFSQEPAEHFAKRHITPQRLEQSLQVIRDGDEEVRFGGVGNRQRQPRPGAAGIQRPLVVPGAEEREHLPSERRSEQTVGRVQRPDDVAAHGAQRLAPQEALEVHVPAAL